MIRRPVLFTVICDGYAGYSIMGRDLAYLLEQVMIGASIIMLRKMQRS